MRRDDVSEYPLSELCILVEGLIGGACGEPRVCLSDRNRHALGAMASRFYRAGRAERDQGAPVALTQAVRAWREARKVIEVADSLQMISDIEESEAIERANIKLRYAEVCVLEALEAVEWPNLTGEMNRHFVARMTDEEDALEQQAEAVAERHLRDEWAGPLRHEHSRSSIDEEADIAVADMIADANIRGAEWLTPVGGGAAADDDVAERIADANIRNTAFRYTE